jgi:hypothetical protein
VNGPLEEKSRGAAIPDERQRRQWNRLILSTVPWAAAIAVLGVSVMVGFEISVLLRPIPIENATAQYGDLMLKQLWMRATEVMMGYVVGALCVSAGLVFVWNGVEASVKLGASMKPYRLRITTANGGVFIVVVGALLVAATILSPRMHIGPHESGGGPESINPPTGQNEGKRIVPFNL